LRIEKQETRLTLLGHDDDDDDDDDELCSSFMSRNKYESQ
jgi:hypothetical protein